MIRWWYISKITITAAMATASPYFKPTYFHAPSKHAYNALTDSEGKGSDEKKNIFSQSYFQVDYCDFYEKVLVNVFDIVATDELTLYECSSSE